MEHAPWFSGSKCLAVTTWYLPEPSSAAYGNRIKPVSVSSPCHPIQTGLTSSDLQDRVPCYIISAFSTKRSDSKASSVKRRCRKAMHYGRCKTPLKLPPTGKLILRHAHFLPIPVPGTTVVLDICSLSPAAPLCHQSLCPYADFAFYCSVGTFLPYPVSFPSPRTIVNPRLTKAALWSAIFASPLSNYRNDFQWRFHSSLKSNPGNHLSAVRVRSTSCPSPPTLLR